MANEVLMRSTIACYRSGLFKVGLDQAKTIDPTPMEMSTANLIDKYLTELAGVENKYSTLDLHAINQSLPGIGLAVHREDKQPAATDGTVSIPRVVCFISHEEHQLRPFLEHLPFVRVCNLKTGDIAIVKDNSVTFLLERKTTADMLSSVKTNRFAKQRERLAVIGATALTTRVGLLMEWDGKRDSYVNETDLQILTSALHNAMYTENLNVFTTLGLLGTVLWCVAQIRSHLLHTAGVQRAVLAVPSKCPSLLKTPPATLVGPGTFLSRAAGCAAHMSAFRAIGLLAKWVSIRDLCLWVETHGVEKAKEVIAGLPFLSENQLRRKRNHDIMVAGQTETRTKIGSRCATSLLTSLGFPV
jgi:hypothetical protein